jgi:hypothetical protein
VDDNQLSIMFNLDSLVDAHIRVNVCVTEKKNENNSPTMFYTPNREDYIQQMVVTPSMKQDICEGMIIFAYDKMTAFELSKVVKDYYPMIISINYTDNGQQYAMMSYCTFLKNGEGKINGVQVQKQVVLIHGLPFEIKTVYGAVNEDDVHEGQHAVIDDEKEKECMICLSVDKDTIVMPCAHLCICSDCGKQLIAHK